MAQFVSGNQIPGQQQFTTSQVFQQQQPRIVQQQQPVMVSQQQQPVIVQSQPVAVQQPVIFQQQQQYPNRYQGENDSLLQKESSLALLFKKFLFYAPCCFFFLLLVFSITLYCLRFQHTNGTTPLAVDTLTNFGNALNEHPIQDLVILSKYVQTKSGGKITYEPFVHTATGGKTTVITPAIYKRDSFNKIKIDTNGKKEIKTPAVTSTSKVEITTTGGGIKSTKPVVVKSTGVLNTCEKQGKVDSGDVGRYTELTFGEFAKIDAGCVCKKDNLNGNPTLTYHDEDYCQDNLKDCQIVTEQDAIKQKYFEDNLFCILRARQVKWLRVDDKKTCKDYKDDKGVDYLQCGLNYCVSQSSKGIHTCPFTSIKVLKKTTTASDAQKAAEKQQRLVDSLKDFYLKKKGIAKNNNPQDILKSKKAHKVWQQAITRLGEDKSTAKQKAICNGVNNKPIDFIITPVNSGTSIASISNAVSYKDLVVCVERAIATTPYNRLAINLDYSISAPRCLAQNLQRPKRLSTEFYHIQHPQETGCKPYGAHIYSKDSDEKTDMNSGYVGVYSQKNDNIYNGINTAQIPFYDSNIIQDEDHLNVYTQVRPNVRNTNQCRDANIEKVAERSAHITEMQRHIEGFNLAFIICSAIGLFLALIFIALRLKNVVNPTTQFLLHFLAFILAIVVFIYGIMFFVKRSDNNLGVLDSELLQQQLNKCYMYAGQTEASTHLYKIMHTINNSIYGITIFLFVLACIYLLLVILGSIYRLGQKLVVCQPLKGDNFYYEN